MKIKMSKEEVVDLIVEKNKDPVDKRKSFKNLSDISGYSKRQLIRIANELKDYSKKEVIEHKNKGRVPSNAALDSEIKFMERFKTEYPDITITQFKDYVDEDYLTKKWYVSHYHLKLRSYSWYENLFHKEGWKSPIRHKRCSNGLGDSHCLRPPRPCKGELVQIDGTPHDWFGTGKKYCLHLAVDDATSEILAGYFTENECLYGYCQLMVIVLDKYGIPMATFSDRHQIFKSQDGTLTNFGRAMDELGIEMIYAMTPQAKGRVERMNFTEQNRLVNDLKRFKVKDDLDSLNDWFNSFYVNYFNKKFAFTPLDPHSAFVEIEKGQYDYNALFTLRFERITELNSSFSFEGHIFTPIDEKTGEVIYIRKGVKLDVRFEILTRRVVIVRYGKTYICKDLGVNTKLRRKNTMENIKDIAKYFEEKEIK